MLRTWLLHLPMLAKTYSSTVFGIDATTITIEVNLGRGINFFLVAQQEHLRKASCCVRGGTAFWFSPCGRWLYPHARDSVWYHIRLSLLYVETIVRSLVHSLLATTFECQAVLCIACLAREGWTTAERKPWGQEKAHALPHQAARKTSVSHNQPIAWEFKNSSCFPGTEWMWKVSYQT